MSTQKFPCSETSLYILFDIVVWLPDFCPNNYGISSQKINVKKATLSNHHLRFPSLFISDFQFSIVSLYLLVVIYDLDGLVLLSLLKYGRI